MSFLTDKQKEMRGIADLWKTNCKENQMIHTKDNMDEKLLFVRKTTRLIPCGLSCK